MPQVAPPPTGHCDQIVHVPVAQLWKELLNALSTDRANIARDAREKAPVHMEGSGSPLSSGIFCASRTFAGHDSPKHRHRRCAACHAGRGRRQQEMPAIQLPAVFRIDSLSDGNGLAVVDCYVSLVCMRDANRGDTCSKGGGDA
jgi:hypothetical protein